MGRCLGCGRESPLISKALGLCRDCILEGSQKIHSRIIKAHQESREEFNLSPFPPRDKEGLPCNYCFNQCQIGRGKAGFCGVRKNQNGQKLRPFSQEAYLAWYYDPLPTNCVASWVCPGGTGAGYPDYSYSRGPEYGFKNLAVFYYGCTFNCLFCQNWQHKQFGHQMKTTSAKDLVQHIDERTSCVCYFGGDPTPQLPHSIFTARLALSQKRNKILRFCWETNGTMNSHLLETILAIALESGGCVKFDLKTFNPQLNMALCGRSNGQTLKNFELAANWSFKRKEPPLVIASTLLVPGYINTEEVGLIAKFIASLNPEIPYSLLAFYPHFYFKDLPCTSRIQAEESRQVALEAGIKKVNIGNIHLLT